MSLSIARQDRESEGPGFGPDDPARLAVRAALADIAGRIERDETAAMDGDVEGLHRLRAALRRLREIVRAFAPLLDPKWAAGTADDCRWAGQWLGQVRDLDVLEAGLREATPEADREALRPIVDLLKGKRRPARQALRKGLASERFRDLRERCRVASQRPPTVAEAERPGVEVLPGLLEAAWKPLRKKGRRLDRDDPDTAFHAVRIRAKRARYAAEMIAPGLPRGQAEAALKLARRATAIQDCLGALQDTVVASEFLAIAGSRFPDDRVARRVIKRLLKAQEREARRARGDFRKLWGKLERVHGLA